jgi:hypothetical protein
MYIPRYSIAYEYDPVYVHSYHVDSVAFLSSCAAEDYQRDTLRRTGTLLLIEVRRVQRRRHGTPSVD